MLKLLVSHLSVFRIYVIITNKGPRHQRLKDCLFPQPFSKQTASTIDIHSQPISSIPHPRYARINQSNKIQPEFRITDGVGSFYHDPRDSPPPESHTFIKAFSLEHGLDPVTGS